MCVHTQRTAGVTCDKRIIEYMQDEYCETLLTISTHTVDLLLLCQNMEYLILVDVIQRIQRLMRFDYWSSDLEEHP